MKEMVKRTGDLFRDGLSGGYTYREDIADGEISEEILILPTGRGTSNGTIVLICGAGTGKVQTSIDTMEDINSGDVTWIDWDKGDVTDTVMGVFVGPVTAIRAVSISGAITFKLLM